MKETLCSLELSKLAQEIGFDWKCDTMYIENKLISLINRRIDNDIDQYYMQECGSNWEYIEDGDLKTLKDILVNPDHYIGDEEYAAPTLSHLQKFIRKTYNYHVCPDTTSVTKNPSKGIWMYRIDNLKDLRGDYIYHSEDDDLYFKSYEEALEDGLINVCKIIKNEISSNN